MMLKISTLALAIALLIPSGGGVAQAQTGSGQSGIRARARGRKLALTSRGKMHLLDVSEGIDAARLDDVSVLFATSRGGFTYLVIAACGSSKDKSDDRQCGAGIECNLLWLKLSDRWKMSDFKSVRYESCWSPISSAEGYKISGKTLQLDFYDLRKKVNVKLTYDADRPENGFHLEETPIKDEG